MGFEQRYADAACNFFERVLKHTADEWYGKPFVLAPWQEEALTEIFGRVDDDGNRRIKLAYMEVPKKAGKTEWAAGLLLYCATTDPNPGCQVYGAGAAPGPVPGRPSRSFDHHGLRAHHSTAPR